MTQEEKRLLEIELATRSQYGVICAVKPVAPFHDLEFGGKQKIKNICIRENDSIFTFGPYEVHGVENIKPYLRPMSSMTEKEKKVYDKLRMNYYKLFSTESSSNLIDWLNAHHFDYHIDPSTGKTLIESGLAIEAPADMYKP